MADDDRLRILEQVSRGELSPEEGRLRIAMLRTSPPAAPARPRLWHTPASARRHQGPVTWPVLLALALPFVIVAALGVLLAAAVLAALSVLVVAVWNRLAALGGLPAIALVPTFWVLVVLTLVWVAARFYRKLRGTLPL